MLFCSSAVSTAYFTAVVSSGYEPRGGGDSESAMYPPFRKGYSPFNGEPNQYHGWITLQRSLMYEDGKTKKTSSSLTSTVDSTEVSRPSVRYCIQCALVTACPSFASARTFIFSSNLFTNLHGMVGCCTSCYIFEFRGAAITLPVTNQYRLQRFVLLIRECSEECMRLASGNYNITQRSQFDTNAAQIPELFA